MPKLQSRGGLFADEIRDFGSYSRWINTHPYDRDPWIAEHGLNVYYRSRLSFVRHWLGDATAGYGQLVMFELFPWHSTGVTGSIRVPSDIVEEFVWQPIAELPVDPIFAFGRPWEAVARSLALPMGDVLGYGGRDYGSTVPSRAVRLFGLPSGQRLVVEWHQGSAGPPKASEVEILRDALR